MASPVRHALVLAPLLLLACAVNPATGNRQFMLISESQEIELGRENDGAIQAAYGVYDDPALSEFVSEMGLRMARASERPDLPWTFRVLDDPVVNAFALPGGFNYVTRGILAHLNSEAELAGVLGHEIGHVTARHSVARMSRQQLQQLGLGIGVALVPEADVAAPVLQGGLAVLNLGYGRDDERESDALGVRYMTRAGYDARELVGVFRTLGLVSGDRADRIPGWRSTHPAPEDREARIEALLAETGVDYSTYRSGTEAYLRRLDGLVFGPNPREGFFTGSLFRHPDLRFRIRFPDGWSTANQKSQVGAGDPEGEALAVLAIVQGSTPETAARAFIADAELEIGGIRSTPVNGLDAARFAFRATTTSGTVEGEAVFVAFDGRVYRILAYGSRNGWRTFSSALGATIDSFAPESDPEVLGVEPWRVDVVSLPGAMTTEAFLERYPSIVEDATVLRINRIAPGERLGAGRLLKRVTGRALPGS